MQKKEKIEVIILISGIIILIGDFSRLLLAGRQPDVGIAGEVKYTGRGHRDPLDNSAVIEEQSTKEITREGVKVFPKENFFISAVIWGSKTPQAIINDKVVKVGEKLDGAEVVGIDKEGVHLEFEGKEVILPIK